VAGLDAKGLNMARGDGSITALMKDGTHVYRDGMPVYRVRFVDPVDGRQKERQVAGLAEAETLLARYVVHKSRKTTARFVPVRATFDELAQPFLTDFRFKLNGERRPYSTWHKTYANLYCYVLPALGGTRIGDMSTLGLVEFVRGLTRRDGNPLAAGSRQNVATTLKAFYKWARLHNFLADNPADGLPSRWAATTKRRVLIPSVNDVLRLARTLDSVSRNRSGDLAIVMGLVGLRWEELVGLPRDDDHVDMNRCTLRIDRVASESGGKRELRMLAAKSAASVREVVVPDLAVAAVQRMLDRDADDFARLAPPPPPRPAAMGVDDYYMTAEYKDWFRTAPWARLANGLYYGGFYSHQTWTDHLRKARVITAEQPEGEITYTAHQLRHVAASLLIASGATHTDVMAQMGHSSIATTVNIYGHLFEADRRDLLARLNDKITGLYVVEADPTAA
jgi:integrase